VRHDVPGIDVRPRRKLAHVVPEIDAGGLSPRRLEVALNWGP
jgi:hypothetical protein